KYTVFAEGARGHLGRQLLAKFNLQAESSPSSFGLGIKEVWQIDPKRHTPGCVLHSAGWPLDRATYGGGFLYHLPDNKIALGFITGLNYTNPWLSPYEEFQRWKTHPHIRWYLESSVGTPAKRLSYGARAINASGLTALPKLVFPGGLLVGCEAGFLNVSRIKGSHAAIKSGMLAAEALLQALQNHRQHDELTNYPDLFRKSWLYHELNKDRNFKSWFRHGLVVASIANGFEQLILRGHIPWTLKRTQADHAYTLPASQCTPIDYPPPDGKITFDKLSSVFLSNTNHEENQPAHLTLKDTVVPVAINYPKYAGPEARYCPAGVYEFLSSENQTEPVLRINAQNCVHCKTCDIKDPEQNIVWVAPEGGGGPMYTDM
ncbi:MAG: electron transfer flavoprotein-ubiquinone oxidoreductase, partial [Gammaproteobacteria bacterium]|nr:electron transfer flavoprotein-ubiquinone oxidoreductase [Gammaproteobacteria bacterium]